MPSGDNTRVMTKDLVISFLAEAFDGESLSKKAKRYPCTGATLSDIRNGRSWRDVQPEQTKRKL